MTSRRHQRWSHIIVLPSITSQHKQNESDTSRLGRLQSFVGLSLPVLESRANRIGVKITNVSYGGTDNALAVRLPVHYKQSRECL